MFIEVDKVQCTYCKTENNEMEIRCTFCEAELHSPRPKIKPFISFDGFKKHSELNTFHTYDLLKLLKDVRKQRSDAFNLLRMALKLENETEVPPEFKNATEDDYKRFTAYMNLIEEILIDRIGYKPKRIDDKLLIAWANRIGLQEY